MARHLDINPDQPRALVPQWMTDQHDSNSGSVMNSALVEKGSLKRVSEDPGGRHDKGTWRSDDRPAESAWASDKHANPKSWIGDHTEKVWGAADQFHHPQPERPVPPGARGARRENSEFTGQGKVGDRWREDGQSRWGHSSNHHEPGLPSWNSPSKSIASDSLPGGDNSTWSRGNQGHSTYQRPTPSQQPLRADANRWGPNAGKWGPEDHHTPSRPSPWETSKTQGYEHSSKDAPRNGMRGFTQFGRGKPLGRDTPSGPGNDRWTPSVFSQAPHEESKAVEVVSAKLGHGPQKHKYTIEQLLSIYADLSEKGQFKLNTLALARDLGDLPAPETEASLLRILNSIAQSMVEEGFATKAERRLASRLNSLLDASEHEKFGGSEVRGADDSMVSPGSAIGSGFSATAQPQDAPKNALPDQLFEHQSTPFSAVQHSEQKYQPPHGQPQAPHADPPEHYQRTSFQGQDAGTGDLGSAAQRPEAAAQASDGAAEKEEEWYYKDPRGEIQGPYSQKAIETWHDSGFFPPDLPLSTTREAAQWRPLQQVLAAWRTPPQQPPTNNLLPADSFLSHQTSGQTPQAAAQSAASRMLEAAETGIYSQASSSFASQGYGHQAPHQHQPQQQPAFQPSLLQNHPSYPMEPSNPYLQQQMNHQLGDQMNQQHMGHQQMSHPGGNQDLNQFLLNQQMSQRLPQYAQMNPQGDQFIPGLTGLDEKLKSMGLQGSRQYDSVQPYEDMHSARGSREQANDLLSRLQGRRGQPPLTAQPAPNQADPIVDLLGSLTGRDSHHASTSLAPIGPQPSQPSSQHYQSAQQPFSAEQSSGFQLDEWLRARSSAPQDQRPLTQQNLHSDASSFDLHPTAFDREVSGNPQGAAKSLNFPSHIEPARLMDPTRSSVREQMPPPEHRPVADQIVQPKHKPAIAAVGPPKKSSAPAPATRMMQPAKEDSITAEESQAVPFQKVQKARKREAGLGEMQPPPPPPPPPPATKAPQKKPPLEQKASQETHQGPTLAEAAGLMTHQEPSDPHPAPWAAQMTKGNQQKTLLDIQREEAEQARIREEQEAVAAAAAAASAPAALHSSWAKPIAKPSPPAVLSFAEIQEQEKRQRSGVPPPPPPPASAQPQWGSSSTRDGKTLANRLSQSIQNEAPKRTKPQVARTQASKGSARPSQDDELFWDPKPGSRDVHRNGSAEDDRALAIAIEESQREQDVSQAEGSLSPEFATWCRSKLRELGKGADDLNLILFLMTVGSNTDVADYMTQFFGKTQAVAAFSNEFIKRKLVEQNAGKKKSKKQKAAQSSTAASSNSGIGVAPLNAGAATGWSKLANKKKPKKGQKMDSTMLGFGTGTDYSALEKLEG